MSVKFSSKRPLTDEQIAQARPFRDAFPELAASIDKEIAKRGRPPVESPRQQISVRLDPEVIKRYKETGKGWQGRMNDDLRKAVGI